MMEIVTLTPYGTTVDYEHRACIDQLHGMGVRSLRTHGITCVEQARDFLAAHALSVSRADVFVWIDHDMVFEPADVAAIAKRCLEGPYAVLGAAYSKRQPGSGIVADFDPSVENVTFYQPGLYPARAVGFGFCAVRRQVFEALAKTLPRVLSPASASIVWPFHMSMIEDATYIGEDWAFCRRATAAGFRVGVDAEPRVLHKGAYKFAIEDTGIVVPRCSTLTVELARDDTELQRADLIGETP